ncbi:hypothetical protein O4H61_11670 [Roseovarius aestuarii]|nr:hypothetical protein [Roseovarius aestuarii]
MKVLIAESNPDLGRLWQRHMDRQGMTTRLETGQSGAISALQTQSFDVIVLNLVLSEGSAIAIADFASYRHPESQIVFVTNTSFFSDGSIFSLNANTRALVQTDTPPEDLTAMVEHYGRIA